jgi:hypothetical protein
MMPNRPYGIMQLDQFVLVLGALVAELREGLRRGPPMVIFVVPPLADELGLSRGFGLHLVFYTDGMGG